MYKAAVSIIVKGDKVLMGYATSKDFRYKKWSFIGGGIERGESPIEAAERESREEANIVVTARPGELYSVDGKESIVYVICDYVKGMPVPNDEFFQIGWFDINDLPIDTLELNAKIIANLLK